MYKYKQINKIQILLKTINNSSIMYLQQTNQNYHHRVLNKKN